MIPRTLLLAGSLQVAGACVVMVPAATDDPASGWAWRHVGESDRSRTRGRARGDESCRVIHAEPIPALSPPRAAWAALPHRAQGKGAPASATTTVAVTITAAFAFCRPHLPGRRIHGALYEAAMAPGVHDILCTTMGGEDLSAGTIEVRPGGPRRFVVQRDRWGRPPLRLRVSEL